MARFEHIIYEKLGGGGEDASIFERSKAFLWYHRQALLLALLWPVATGFVAVGYANLRVNRAMKFCNQFLYSPAQDSIAHHIQVFTSGFNEEISEFQGPPTPEVEAAWDDLIFGVGVGSWITFDEAKRLANETTRFGPAHPELYVITLDVFHQLHCLNTLRQLSYAEEYSESARPNYLEHVFEHGHLSHCIDSIRQSLMCHADITPIVLQWDPEQQISVWRGDMPHTCRDFGKITEWGKARAVETIFHDVGDWMDPNLIVDGPRKQIL